MNITHTLEQNPVIAAVNDEALLDAALQSGCGVVFLLCGDVCSVGGMVERAVDAGKLVLVHIDLVSGLSAHESAVRFIKEQTRADGVLSTKAHMVRAAKDNGLVAVQRFFVLDSMALGSIGKQALGTADMIEVLPAVSPEVVSEICAGCRLPVIVGGLIRSKKDAIEMLGAGAIAISTSSPTVWKE